MKKCFLMVAAACVISVSAHAQAPQFPTPGMSMNAYMNQYARPPAPVPFQFPAPPQQIIGMPMGNGWYSWVPTKWRVGNDGSNGERMDLDHDLSGSIMTAPRKNSKRSSLLACIDISRACRQS